MKMDRAPLTVAFPLFFLLLLHFQMLPSVSQSLNLTDTAAAAGNKKEQAILVFGDSIVDTGNNNVLHTPGKCDFPPYGRDFVGHQPTGRFSNGKVPSDLIASYLRIKEYVPAYLGTELDDQDLLTGVCFASGGYGYDPLTSVLVSALTSDQQLNLFKEYKQKIKSIVGEQRAAYIVDISFYLLVAGTDDIANTYFGTPIRQIEYDLPSYVNFVVQSASSFIQELYKEGARKFGITGAPPIGCLPSQRTIAGGIERQCQPRYNQAAVMYNAKLSTELLRLNNTLPGANILYLDIYTPVMELISNPSAYGFEQVTRGCCGTGTFEVTMTCNSLTTPTCEDDTKYVFWDSFHPTEAAYKYLVNNLVGQNSLFFT